MDSKTTVPEEALERIADALWNKQSGGGVELFDIYQHDACNHTASGIIYIDAQAFGFIIEMGDRNGCVVHAWGDPEEVGTYQPPPPTEPRTFIPRDRYLHINKPAAFRVYVLWRQEPWFMEKVAAYLYDRHFQPGCYVENHYGQWAATKRMVIGLLSDLPEEARAMIAARNPQEVSNAG